MTAKPARMPPSILPTSRRPHPATVSREKKSPRHLSPEAAAFWRAVTADYELEPHHRAILERACEALDRMRQAQQAIRDDGAYIDGRFGMKAHPALAVERDSRTAHLRALRELGLDLETPAGRAPSRWRR